MTQAESAVVSNTYPTCVIHRVPLTKRVTLQGAVLWICWVCQDQRPWRMAGPGHVAIVPVSASEPNRPKAGR